VKGKTAASIGQKIICCLKEESFLLNKKICLKICRMRNSLRVVAGKLPFAYAAKAHLLKVIICLHNPEIASLVCVNLRSIG